MAPAIQGRLKDASAPEFVSNREKSSALLELVKRWLDEAKATELVAIDLRDKSVISDYMVIASGNNETPCWGNSRSASETFEGGGPWPGAGSRAKSRAIGY